MRKKIFILSLSAMLLPFFAFASVISGTLDTGLYTGPYGYLMQNPVANPGSGTYTHTQSVTLSATGNTTIRYTLDGTNPACPNTGTLYNTTAFSVTIPHTLKAIACYAPDSSVPTAVVTYNYTSGGGGGGGGGGYYPTPTPTPTPSASPTPTPTLGPVTIPTLPPNPTQADYQNLLNALIQQLAYLQAQLTAQQGTPTPTPTPGAGYKFTHGLAFGDTGEDVRQLQIFLKAQGTSIYPEGLITGYFGPLTQKAVERFQVKYGIAGPGDPGYGYVGPKTRAKINALQGL